MLETINTFSPMVTLVVITATAIAAMLQIRHLRDGNKLAGLLNVLARVEDSTFNARETDAMKTLPGLLADPAYRRSILNGTFDRTASWLSIGNSYDWVGSLAKRGLIPEDAVLDIYSGRIVASWELLADVIGIVRRGGDDTIWENFEYLYVRSQDWRAKHPAHYPAGVPRAIVRDRWREEDLRLEEDSRPAELGRRETA